jgi:hypothetical protein
MSSFQVEEFNDVFEIENGIIGVKRDIAFELIELMYFREDETVQNVFLCFLFLMSCLFIHSVDWNKWRMC